MTEPEELKANAIDRFGAVAGISSRSTTCRAITLAAAVLALPALYLAIGFATAPKSVFAGQAAAQSSSPAMTTADLELLAQKTPTPANRLNLSLAYINGGAPERALPVLLGLVAEDATDAVAWNDLCVANTLLKSYDLAVEDCATAIRLQPNFTLAQNNLKWTRAEKQKALAAGSGVPAAVARDANFYLNDGLKQLNAGLYDQAIESWRRTLELDPKNAIAMNNIGTAHMMKKQPDEALTWFSRALNVDPTLQLAKNNIAWANQVKEGKP
jgi:tetratricopeptide (TPR) repeat protein